MGPSLFEFRPAKAGLIENKGFQSSTTWVIVHKLIQDMIEGIDAFNVDVLCQGMLALVAIGAPDDPFNSVF